MRTRLMLVAVALLATACKPAADTASTAPAAAPAETAAPAASVAPVATTAPAADAASVAAEAPAPTRLRGKGLMGKDGFGLTLCGEATQRIAILDPDAQAALDRYLAGGAHEFTFDGWGDLVGMDKVHVARFEHVAADGSCDAPSLR